MARVGPRDLNGPKLRTPSGLVPLQFPDQGLHLAPYRFPNLPEPLNVGMVRVREVPSTRVSLGEPHRARWMVESSHRDAHRSFANHSLRQALRWMRGKRNPNLGENQAGVGVRRPGGGNPGRHRLPTLGSKSVENCFGHHRATRISDADEQHRPVGHHDSTGFLTRSASGDLGPDAAMAKRRTPIRRRERPI